MIRACTKKGPYKKGLCNQTSAIKLVQAKEQNLTFNIVPCHVPFHWPTSAV